MGFFGGGGGSSSTLTTLTGAGFYYPMVPLSEASTFTFHTGLLIDASGEKGAFVFEVPRTGTLDKAEFKLSTVAQAPASGLRVSFQDVSTTNGDPAETVIPAPNIQYRDVTSGISTGVWLVPGLMTTDGTDGGTKRSVTKGDFLAVVVEFVSFAASDSVRLLDGISTTTIVGFFHNLYRESKTSGVWTKSRSTCSLALKYNDGTYAYTSATGLPYLGAAAETYANNTNPNERGLIFQFPVPVTVSGAWARVNVGAGGTDLVLYDADGTTALATVTLDSDMDTGADSSGQVFVYFPTAVTLLANTNYRLTHRPNSTTTTSLYSFTVNSAAIMDAFEGGQAWHWTQQHAVGGWSQTTTKRPFMGLYVTAVHDGG